MLIYKYPMLSWVLMLSVLLWSQELEDLLQYCQWDSDWTETFQYYTQRLTILSAQQSPDDYHRHPTTHQPLPPCVAQTLKNK